MIQIIATPPPWAPAHGWRDNESIPEPGAPILLSITVITLLMRRGRRS